jgi:hypothetical protein
MKTANRVGAIAALVGVIFILVGLFSSIGSCAVAGVPCPSPSWNEILAYLGAVVLLVGIATLVWSGWHGSAGSWMLAAVSAVPAIWFVYELGRQSICPLINDPVVSGACLKAYGEMTAPVLSFGLGAVLLTVGWLRLRRRGSSRDIWRR